MVANSTHTRYGEPYHQLFHAFPQLSGIYTDYEKNFDPIPTLETMKSLNYTVPVVCIVLYLLFCFLGKKIMSDRKPFDLITPLMLWNLGLSLFSCYGALRTAPHLINRFMTLPFEATVCEHTYTAFGTGAAGFATQLFILSKIPELVDTVFIVLRKKPLIFLHWYHHVTVLIYCWNAYVTESAAGLWFVAMNYMVHAVMYFYYFLQAARIMPRWFPSWVITIMQISQMVVGTFIVCSSLYFHFNGSTNYAPGECNNKPSNLVLGGVIYASYLYLFVEFALKRFVFTKPKTKKSA